MARLIKDAWILTMEPDQQGGLRAPFLGNIAIEDGLITQVGQVTGDFDEVLDGRDMLAMPGLINTHGHAAMSLFRGYGDDMALMSWLHDKIWPVEAKLTPADVKKGSLLAALEMIKSGTTCFADMYFFCEETAQAVVESGIRAAIARGVTSPAPEEKGDKIAEGLAFALEWRGQATGRITTMLGPHAPYTCTPEFLQQLAELARKHHLPLHIHLAETQDELNQIQTRYGCRPVEYLERCNFFYGNKVLAAHGVWLDEAEMAFLAQHDVSIAHNPASNMKLASGMAPTAALLKAGVNVALGTDSACSNNNLDLFEEIKLAALLAKTRDLDPLALPAAQVLQMATVNGAKALGLEDCGQIKAGMAADIILIDLDQPQFYPRHDLVSHLAYAAGGADVDTMIVAGQDIMRGREVLTLDEERILREAEACAQDLCHHR